MKKEIHASRVNGKLMTKSFQRRISILWHWDIEIECMNKNFFMNGYYVYDLLKLKVVAYVVAYVAYVVAYVACAVAYVAY